jgi:hypothetical protein
MIYNEGAEEILFHSFSRTPVKEFFMDPFLSEDS